MQFQIGGPHADAEDLAKFRLLFGIADDRKGSECLSSKCLMECKHLTGTGCVVDCASKLKSNLKSIIEHPIPISQSN